MRPFWIKNLLASALNRHAAKSPETLSPAETFYAIGDIHGRRDLLQTLLTSLDEAVPIVLLGDYVDRGPDSAGVLQLVMRLETLSDRSVTCLLGNHEDMLLRFLDDPFAYAAVWFRNGGTQTLASYGIADIDEFEIEPDRVAHELAAAMGATMIRWLGTRPLIWTSGNVSAVHAAMDPSRALGNQPRRTCLWGHPKFPRKRRKDGQWVVHGHTIVDEPTVAGRVISVDTGAFDSGRLTAAEVSAGNIRFLTATSDDICYTDV